MGVASPSVATPPPMRHGSHNGLPARVDRHMLHRNPLLPACAVAFERVHLCGIGSGQLVQCAFGGVLLGNGFHMVEPPRHHHCRLVGCAHLHCKHGLHFIAGLDASNHRQQEVACAFFNRATMRADTGNLDLNARHETGVTSAKVCHHQDIRQIRIGVGENDLQHPIDDFEFHRRAICPRRTLSRYRFDAGLLCLAVHYAGCSRG
jgi:hypothetical protein